MDNKFEIQLLSWSPEYSEDIMEVYRLLKDQEKKIFDLSFYDGLGDEPIMAYVEDKVTNDLVFIVKDNEAEKVAGVFMLEDCRPYKDIVLYARVHCVICKKYWGKGSRDICNSFIEYLKANTKILRLIAEVPQNAYSLIKILKSVGFAHEGTVKRTVVYLDKNGNEKLYDEMLYGLDLGGIDGTRIFK